MPKVVDSAQSSLVTASGGGVYDAASRSVTWSVPDIPPNFVGSVTLLADVAAPLPGGTILTNSASIDSLQSGEARATAVYAVSSAPALVMSKVGLPDPVAAGGRLTYTITLENVGNQDATSVVVVDTLPANTAFVSASDSGVYDPVLHRVTWDLRVLNIGIGPVVLTVVLDVDLDATEVVNVAEVTSAENPPLTATGVVQVQTSTPIPTLSGSAVVLLFAILGLMGVAILRLHSGRS